MEIRTETHGPHVVVVTIDNLPRLNAMTRAMMADLARLWDELERGPCRAIVLTGAGTRAFCAGADISGDLSAAPEAARTISHALLKYDAYDKPIVAAVNGDCAGGGVELLLATDIRAAVPTARFGLPEVKWSIYPFGGATVKLIQQIGHVHAMDLLLTGRLIDAAEAARRGPHGLGPRDRGDDRGQQPVRGAGGEAADQRDHRRARAGPRGAGPGAGRPGAGERRLPGGRGRVPREAAPALRVRHP
jgi:1,4-dihydroxy-2-naphthoyl-CoA synthase